MPTLVGIKYILMQNTPAEVEIKFCRCAREYFVVHVFGFEL